jgi:catechol 2,3-dioxygenase-like lactoylglutathione lyase family enzyme
MEFTILTAPDLPLFFVKALDHVNIRTSDVPGTVRFFSEVLGLTAGEAPGMNADEFAWMFTSAGAPIFHVQLERADSLAPGLSNREGTGPIDHIALDCTGHDLVVAKLTALGFPYRLNEVASAGLRQIFVFEPNGIRLELNFRNAV